MTKKRSKNDVLAPPFWGYTGQNGQKRPFLTPGGGSHTPGGGSHTPKFGGGPPPRTRIGAFLDFLGCRCFLEMCKQVLQRFVQICFDNFSEIILWKICGRSVPEILQKRWWQIDRWLDRLLENILWKTLCKIWSVTDRPFVEDFVRDLWKTHLTKIFERAENKKMSTRCWQKISTRCVKFLRSRLATFETHASVDTQPIANRCVRSEIWLRNRPFPVFLTDLLHYSTQQIPKNRGRFLVNFPVCARALATDYRRWVDD